MQSKVTWREYGALAIVLPMMILTGCGGSSGTGNTAGRSDLQNTRATNTLPDGNTRAEGQSGRVGIFLSATPDGKAADKGGHLWTNILKVELIDIQEKPVTVFESQDGVSVDLSTLYETGGHRFSLLACPAVPSGKAYIRARVTFGKAFSQFGVSSPTGQMIPLADTIPHDDRENPILSFPLTRPRDLGNGRENLVIDFDLNRMQVSDSRITPALREGDQNGLNDLARQIPATFIGTVQELTGKDAPPRTAATTAAAASADGTTSVGSDATVPDASVIGGPAGVGALVPRAGAEQVQASVVKRSEKVKTAVKKEGDTVDPPPATTTETPTRAETTELKPDAKAKETPVDGNLFTLSLGTNRSITVQAGEATVYDNDGAAPNPSLLEGKKAAVRGILDPVTKRVLAQRITILTGEGPTGEVTTVRGSVSGFDVKNNLLILTTTQTEGILPAFATITAQMVPDAAYRSRGGLLLTTDEFSAALAAQPGAMVSISGVYEPVTGSLRGKTARLEENTPGTAHEAKVTGAAQDVDGQAGTLTLVSLTLWQGIAARTESTRIPVITTAATAYRDEKGEFIASANFFQAIKEGRSLQALGLYAGGKLTATRLELIPAEAKPATKPPVASTEVKAGDTPIARPDVKPEEKPAVPSETKDGKTEEPVRPTSP